MFLPALEDGSAETDLRRLVDDETAQRVLAELRVSTAEASDAGEAMLPLIRAGLTSMHLRHLARRWLGVDLVQAPRRLPATRGASANLGAAPPVGVVGASCRLPLCSTGL